MGCIHSALIEHIYVMVTIKMEKKSDLFRVDSYNKWPNSVKKIIIDNYCHYYDNRLRLS